MSEEEDVSDLLPNDQELCQRTSRWSKLFGKFKEDNEEEDLAIGALQYIASGSSCDGNYQDSPESVDPSYFEDSQEESDFDVKDYLNATQKVIAKRKEGWCRTGIDRLLDNSFNDVIADKVDGWLRNNCDYFSTEFSRDANKQCFNEIKINERNIILERNIDHESEDSSVDTAKYILSNRKNRKSRVTMTIKEFCYTTQKRDHAPMPGSIKEANSRKFLCCNNMETPSTVLDKNYFSHAPKRCIPLHGDSHKSQQKRSPYRNEDRSHRPTPKKRTKSMPQSPSGSLSDSYRPQGKTPRYYHKKSPLQKKVENVRSSPLKRVKSTKCQQHHSNSGDLSDSSSDRHRPHKTHLKTLNYLREKSTAQNKSEHVRSSPLKRIKSTKRRQQQLNRSIVIGSSSSDDGSSEETAVRRAHRGNRKSAKNSQRTNSRRILSDSKSTIENKCQNDQETCSVRRKEIQKSSIETSKKRPQEVSPTKDTIHLKNLKVNCLRMDPTMLPKAKRETNVRCPDSINETAEALDKPPSDLNFTNVGIINSTAIQSQESMFLCKKNFESICSNSPKRSSTIENKSVDNTTATGNNNSTMASKRNSATPIILYSPFTEKVSKIPLKNGQVHFTHNDIDKLIGADMRKKCLGNKRNFQISANSELMYIPPPEVVMNSDSDSEVDDLELLSFKRNGKILEVVHL